MAVLNRDEFFSRIETVMGDDTSDEMLTFMEDMRDTYDDLETRASERENGEDWESKYHELDNTWRKKYKDTFFSGVNMRREKDDEEIEEKKDVTYDDLFD